MAMALATFCTASFLHASEDFRRPNIEAVQRAIQERYLTWVATVQANGVEPEGFPAKITWPALSNGKQPGDSPKDCFYSEELVDAETGEINYNLLCFLIADLVNKTVSFLPDSEFADPDLADRINGRSQITLPPAIWPGSQVNPDNYNAFFEAVCAHVQRHSHPIVEIRSTDDSGDFDVGGAGRGVEDDASTCAAARAAALSDLAVASEDTEQDLLLGRADRVYFIGSTHTASIAAWRGRYGFDHSAFGPLGGTAKLYFFARDYFKVVDGTPSTVPLTVGGAPVPEYEKQYLIDTFSLSSGGKHFTTEVGTLPTSFVSQCPSLEGEANGQRFGYFIHPIVIAAPNFSEQIGEIYTDCKECKACMSGACPPGGTSTAKAGSITYSIPLGSSLDGSAGSMTIYSETADFLMATPFGLKITAGKDSTILRDLSYDGIPRQVVVPQGLVDIKVDTPAKAYSIRFYDVANRGAKVGGFYQPAASAAYKTVSVTNPGLNSKVITGKFNLTLNNYQISAPAHGLTPGSYYVMRVDADSGSLPAGFAIGRIGRQHLYYVYALNTSTLAFLYFNAAGSAFLDGMTDAIPGQVLKFSSPFPFTSLTISEVTEGLSRSLDYSYQTPSSTRGIATLTDATSTRTRVHTVDINYVDSTHRTEEQTEADGAGNIILKTLHKYEVLPWNRAAAASRSERQTLVAEISDPDGRALTTSYSYYTNSTADGPNYSRLKEVLRPQGAWERYEYDADGRAVRTYSSYLDALPTSSGSNSRLSEQSSTGGAPIADADGDGVNENIESSIEYIKGAEVSRSYQLTWSAIDALGRQRSTSIRCLEPGAAWDAPANVRSDTWSYATGRFVGQLAKRLDESGLLTMYSYSLDPVSGVQTSVEFSGVAGSDRESVIAGTKIVTIVNAAGNVTDVTAFDIASGIVSRHEYTPAAYFDQFGRPTRVYGLDGRYSQSIRQDCCGTATSVSTDGVISSRETDATGQLFKTVRAGITERYSDGYVPAALGTVAGFTRSTYRKGRGEGAEVLVKVDTFDASGTLIATLDPRDGVNRLTRFSEGPNGSGRWTQKVVAPDGGETSHVMYRDGTTFEEVRDGVPCLKYAYGVESATHDGRAFNARTTTEIKLGDDDSELEWEKSFTDPLGRQFRTDWPDADGNAAEISARMYYDSNGHLVRKVDADGISTLFEEDALGNVQTEAMDLNQNGLIDLAGTDRVQRTTRVLVTDPDRGDLVRTTTSVWERDGDPVATALSISDVATNGLQTWSTTHGQTVHGTKAYLGNGSASLSVERPDQTIETTTTQRGVLASQKVEHPTTGSLQDVVNVLDDLDRILSTTNQLTGRVTAFEYFENDSVRKVTDLESAGSTPQITQFQYDVAGRLTGTVRSDGSPTEKRYFTSGQLRAEFGAKEFPTEYTYDRQGRSKTLTTWQRFDDVLGSGIAGAAVTTWTYDARGRLKSKHDSAGKGPQFTYTSGGRISTRTSARAGTDGNNPILTTYRYGTGGVDDLGVTSGDVTFVFYSNDPAETHFVGTQYDRRGRPQTILDQSGARELVYDGEQLDRESYVAHAGMPSLFAGYVLDRDFDGMKRYTGINLAAGGAPIYQVAHGYDGASRLQSVTFGSQKVTYSYNPAATKRIKMDYQRGGQSLLSVEQSFDGLDRLTGRSSVAGSHTKNVTHTYDALNRRTRVTDESGTYRSFGYGDRSQLAFETKRTPDGTAVPLRSFSYTYDDIGNRRAATLNGRLQSYEPNLLNEYQSLAVPRIIEFRGTAHPSATVSIDGVTVADRLDRSFSKELDLTGPPELAAAHSRSIEVKAALNGGGVNAGDRIAIEKRDVFLAKSPIVFAHDADGNLLDDDQWIYVWDAENRLVSMSTKAGFATAADPGAGKRTRLEFSYDSGGRRITKKVFSWQSLSSTWQPVLARSFVYDGWNLLAEFDLSSGARVASYAWGSDLAGDFQSSGGIGGLLFYASTLQTTVPVYDGNGNIVAQVDTANGDVVDEREYDAWGRTLFRANLNEEGCAFGFSTKYRDRETELTYYGLRYLDHGDGRWLSRDPFGEDGGANLRAFVGNNPVNAVDPIGEYGRDVHGYFTYFAVLAAGGSKSDAKNVGAYTWGPDVSRDTNAIGVIYTDFLQTYEVQVKQHALTGAAPEPLRDILLKDTRRNGSLADFGRWSHVFQDSYAHVQVKRALLTWVLRHLGSKRQYERAGILYKKGLGHFFSGTLPDHVSTSPGLFREMSGVYYGEVSARFGGSNGMTSAQFAQYANLLSLVGDNRREEFIKYVVQPCSSPVQLFDDLLKLAHLKRLNLDSEPEKYNLPKDGRQPDWQRLKEWVEEQKY